MSTVQAGNASVSTQGAAGLLLHAYRRGEGHASAVSRGPGRHQQRRTARELRDRPDAGLGAKGGEATQLLQRMAAHAIGRDPAAFLAHADRMLSAALQAGNASVSTQGAAGLLLHAYRRGEGHASAVSRGPGRHQQRRSARELRDRPDAGLGAIVHADYRCARIGVRGPQLAA